MLWLALVPQTLPASSTWPELACRLGRFTPHVVLEADALLAEVEGSRRLFGGLPALLEAVGGDFADLAPSLALAATRRGAFWLARGGGAVVVTEIGAMRDALQGLPLATLPWDIRLIDAFVALGLRRLGDLLALPRGGIRRRFGAGISVELAQALGELPDPPAWYPFPERFCLGLELPAAVESAPALRFAAHRLVAALEGWLAARQQAVSLLELRIGYGTAAPTSLPLDFSRPVHAAAAIERVLAERLAALRLPAPATALELQAVEAAPRSGLSASLFRTDGGLAGGIPGDALAELFDRLAARLGRGVRHGVTLRAEHRPERTTVAVDHATSGKAGLKQGEYEGEEGGTGRRPLWLLDPPEPLVEREGRPYYRQQRLHLMAGPERIESGWWDGGEIRRDYFIAGDESRRCFWIFRSGNISGGDFPHPPGWYLHGLFP